jgi:hypothetical protein
VSGESSTTFADWGYTGTLPHATASSVVVTIASTRGYLAIAPPGTPATVRTYDDRVVGASWSDGGGQTEIIHSACGSDGRPGQPFPKREENPTDGIPSAALSLSRGGRDPVPDREHLLRPAEFPATACPKPRRQAELTGEATEYRRLTVGVRSQERNRGWHRAEAPGVPRQVRWGGSTIGLRNDTPLLGRARPSGTLPGRIRPGEP